MMPGDIILNSQLLGAMLPSPSVLTGNFRPQTAAAFVEQTLAEARTRAACGWRMGTPALSHASAQSQPQPKGSAEEVGALRSMASKHLGQLRQAPFAPYPPQHPPLPARCLSVPPQRPHSSAMQSPLTTLLQPQTYTQPISPRDAPLSTVGGGAAATGGSVTAAARSAGRAAGGADATAPAAATGTAVPSGIGIGSGGALLVTDVAAPHGAITACSSHPFFASHQAQAPGSSSLPRLILGPPDDASTMATVGTPTGLSPPSTARMSEVLSPIGVHSPLPSQHQQQHQQQHQPASSSAPAPLTPGSGTVTQPHPQLQRGPHRLSSLSSRPTTSLSVQDLSLPKPASRLHSRSSTRGSSTQLLDLSRTGSVSGEAAAAASSNSSSGSNKSGGAAATSPTRSVGRFHHICTRMASEAAAAGTRGVSDAARQEGLKVTRGMLYSVFQELDEFDSGRLTYSAFEQGACRIGLRPAQARRLFELLDPLGRGYATMREWISPNLQRQMEAFTRLYVQATRGADGRPKDITEVRSMHMAIQMAMVKLQLKRSGRAVSLDRLVQAFAFMDRDANGALNAEEIEDALSSLGIFVSKEVVESIMRTFDKDGNGCVDYYEFVKSLYPTLDSSVYQY